MKSTLRKVLFSLLVISAVLALSGIASANSPLSKGGGGNWSALDKVERFKSTLSKAGFTTVEGKFEYIDLVKECCEQKVQDTLANNPWPNAYLTVKLPPPAGYPVPVDWIWQLGEDEAIVLIGQTPPPAAYFSFQTFLAMLPGETMRLGIAVGDTTNIATIHTIGPDRVNRPIIYIITGHRATDQLVRAAARAAGYPDAILNTEAVSPVIAPLGFGPQGSFLYMVHRVAMPEDQAALENYIKQPPYRVFRVSPKVPLAPDPQPVPVLRVRGTGHTEMQLYPALKRLRQAIIDRYGSGQELDTHVWWILDQRIMLEKPFVGLQRNLFLMGATRDTNYLATYPNFMLRDGSGEFVIAYGVNHQKAGKATYSSVSVYADPVRWFGVGTLLSRDFAGSAQQYLPGDPDADLLYAIKVTRNCNGEPYCLEVKQPDFKDSNGNPYTCTPPLVLDEQPMFFIFRSYMEPSTKVAPDDNELLYDQAIYFAP